MNVWVTLRSEYPVLSDGDPVFTFQRVGFISADRREFVLHWLKVHADFSYDAQGHLVVKAILSHLSDFADAENVKGGVFPEDVTSSFIKTASLRRLFYDCEVQVDGQPQLVALNLQSFEVSEEGQVFIFPLEKYQKRHHIANQATF